MPGKTGSAPGRPSFDIDDVRDILAGTREPKLLAERDRKGLSPVAFAALKGAAASDALLSLLDEKPQEGEADPVLEMRELLVAVAESVQRLEKKVDLLTKAARARGS